MQEFEVNTLTITEDPHLIVDVQMKDPYFHQNVIIIL